LISHLDGCSLLNQLRMYDIRFAPNGLQSKPKPMSPSHTSTRPYMTFPEYSPDIISDFDVSPELGLLATGNPPKYLLSFPSSSFLTAISFVSASDDCTVQLFSLQTGDLVPSPLSKYKYHNPINCLSFENSETNISLGGPQTPSLLVCSKATVDEWTW